MRPILTDQDVRERMEWLTANGFPGTETVLQAKEFVKYSRGPVAEGAVRELVPRLPEESLNELVREYVCQPSGGRHLLRRLRDRSVLLLRL